jgi:hypothetical protein
MYKRFLAKVYESSAHKVLDPWINDNFIRLDRYTDEKARQRRVPALSKMVYSMAYYLISSVCGYFVIKDTTMIPAWLGGRGQCANAYLNAPHLTEDTLGMQIYILVTFSKDLNRLVTHALIKPEGNYYEYLLHHGLATFLILFSYLSNFWVIGAFIIFIHDFSDLALSAGRFYGVLYLPLRTTGTTKRYSLTYCMSMLYRPGSDVALSSTWVAAAGRYSASSRSFRPL